MSQFHEGQTITLFICRDCHEAFSVGEVVVVKINNPVCDICLIAKDSKTARGTVEGCIESDSVIYYIHITEMSEGGN